MQPIAVGAEVGLLLVVAAQVADDAVQVVAVALPGELAEAEALRDRVLHLAIDEHLDLEVVQHRAIALLIGYVRPPEAFAAKPPDRGGEIEPAAIALVDGERNLHHLRIVELAIVGRGELAADHAGRRPIGDVVHLHIGIDGAAGDTGDDVRLGEVDSRQNEHARPADDSLGEALLPGGRLRDHPCRDLAGGKAAIVVIAHGDDVVLVLIAALALDDQQILLAGLHKGRDVGHDRHPRRHMRQNGQQRGFILADEDAAAEVDGFEVKLDGLALGAGRDGKLHAVSACTDGMSLRPPAAVRHLNGAPLPAFRLEFPLQSTIGPEIHDRRFIRRHACSCCLRVPIPKSRDILGHSGTLASRRSRAPAVRVLYYIRRRFAIVRGGGEGVQIREPTL